MIYKEINIDSKQNRDEWLNWRLGGVGSSDAAVIMGVSRFNDWDSLLQQKSSPTAAEDNINAYVKERGNKIEFQVRMFLEKRDGESLTAKNCEHLTFPFLRASLDGMTPSGKTIVEIKLLSLFNPIKPNYEAEGYVKWLLAKNAKKVPAEYWPQCQHQLFITGADICLFVGYCEHKGNQVVTEDKLAIIEVKPDLEYQKKLLAKEFEFMYSVNELKQKLIYRGELE